MSTREYGLLVNPALEVDSPPPPTHPFAGSNSERQSVGLPGHCEFCAQFGHALAHPDSGCGDVGCNKDHEGQHKPCGIHGRCLQCEGCDECERAAEVEAEIKMRAGELNLALNVAAGALNAATNELGHLMGSRIYDIELAETNLGDDAKAELEAAARAVRNAQRIADWRLKMLGG